MEKLARVASPGARGYMNSLALTGRYRSGQTGQTVNLLALRLRWFESSPAHILPMRVYRAAVLSAENQIGSKRNPLRQRTLQHVFAGKAGWLVAASSLATVTPSAVSAAAVTSTATAATWRSLLARTRLIHSHRPAIHGLAIEFRDGILRFLLRTHRHKGEST